MRIHVATLAAIALLAITDTRLAAEEAVTQKIAVMAPSAGAGDREQIAKGRELYNRMTCVRCHGVNMVQYSTAAFDLRDFPHDDKARFVNSVTKGKNNRMPPWGDVLKPEEIEQLWAYIQTGGKE